MYHLRDLSLWSCGISHSFQNIFQITNDRDFRADRSPSIVCSLVFQVSDPTLSIEGGYQSLTFHTTFPQTHYLLSSCSYAKELVFSQANRFSASIMLLARNQNPVTCLGTALELCHEKLCTINFITVLRISLKAARKSGKVGRVLFLTLIQSCAFMNYEVMDYSVIFGHNKQIQDLCLLCTVSSLTPDNGNYLIIQK